jgi:hypothetical protein
MKNFTARQVDSNSDGISPRYTIQVFCVGDRKVGNRLQGGCVCRQADSGSGKRIGKTKIADNCREAANCIAQQKIPIFSFRVYGEYTIQTEQKTSGLFVNLNINYNKSFFGYIYCRGVVLI